MNIDSERKSKLLETGLFFEHPDNMWLELKKPVYIAMVSDIREVYTYHGENGFYYKIWAIAGVKKRYTFEEIMEQLPDSIRTKLLFHLDLFA